jgi:hypothetical protein
MTAVSTIIPGAKFGCWEVLSVDPTGKRACCSCACGGVHIVSIDALCAGTAACAAVPWTRAQIAVRQAENLRQRRARDLKEWRTR